MHVFPEATQLQMLQMVMLEISCLTRHVVALRHFPQDLALRHARYRFAYLHMYMVCMYV